jgi:hypothetical protein
VFNDAPLEAGIGVWGIADWDGLSRTVRPLVTSLFARTNTPRGSRIRRVPQGVWLSVPLIEHLFRPYAEEKVKALSQWFEY